MPALDYLDFDLEVEAEATPDSYKVSVLSSPRGEASGQMTFPFNSDALENVILKLGRTRSGVRAVGSPTQDLAQKFGGTLYDALFSGEVGTCFRRSLDEADSQGKGLRVRLRLENAPQLADVPWEYLYPTGLRQFLVLSTRTPVVRYLELPQKVPPLRVAPPLQVLVVVCSPAQLATLNVDAEVQRITDALAGLEQAGQVHVTVVARATLMQVRRALRTGGFHVLHFIGHGGFDESSAEGMLAFEDEQHQVTMVSGTTLATTISGFESLRLVVLNACEGARQSPLDPLGGVAQSLVKLGNVPAVVAMQFEITDEAATVFSAEFYAAIADGYPIDAALAEARVAVFSDNNDVEWGTPVLYLRASDGRIFDVASGAAPPPAGAPGPHLVPLVTPPPPSGPDLGASAKHEPVSPSHPVNATPPARKRRMLLGFSLTLGSLTLSLGALATLTNVTAIAPSQVTPIATATANPTSEQPPTSAAPTSTATIATSLPAVRVVPTLRAPRGSVTIDGNTDDWQWKLSARADNPITDTRSSATGDIYLMWDDQALYLLAMIDDTTKRLPDPSQPTRAWRGNSVILELGPDKSGLIDSDPVRPARRLLHLRSVQDRRHPGDRHPGPERQAHRLQHLA
ncbi:CHAT domain-containing protein [Micropruina sp.]|uniref:CHAT domain-containing protein n=1 Tax=Micropruina sp. TaxID=2737536 RepID=UPI0039E42F50